MRRGGGMSGNIFFLESRILTYFKKKRFSPNPPASTLRTANSIKHNIHKHSRLPRLQKATTIITIMTMPLVMTHTLTILPRNSNNLLIFRIDVTGQFYKSVVKTDRFPVVEDVVVDFELEFSLDVGGGDWEGFWLG